MKQMTEAEATIAKDLGVDIVHVVGHKNGRNSNPIVTYASEFKGTTYRHIRPVWLGRDNKWRPDSKGLAFDDNNANDVFKAIGALAV